MHQNQKQGHQSHGCHTRCLHLEVPACITQIQSFSCFISPACIWQLAWPEAFSQWSGNHKLAMGLFDASYYNTLRERLSSLPCTGHLYACGSVASAIDSGKGNAKVRVPYKITRYCRNWKFLLTVKIAVGTHVYWYLHQITWKTVHAQSAPRTPSLWLYEPSQQQGVNQDMGCHIEGVQSYAKQYAKHSRYTRTPDLSWCFVSSRRVCYIVAVLETGFYYSGGSWRRTKWHEIIGRF